MRKPELTFLVMGSLWLVTSCGGSTPPPASSPGGSLAPWDSLSQGEKVERMKTVVVPRMTPVFQELNAEEFAKVGCTTCHGERAKAKNFDMPNPDLPALDPTDGFKVHMDAHPTETKLMMDKVVPEMAAALGEQPYDPKTHEGFGCFECHPKGK